MKRMLMLLFAVVVVIAFFLPWVSVKTEVATGLKKIVKLEIKGIPEQFISISGFQVPVMANSKESRLMITLIKIFKPEIKNADKKSYLIWIVPILAVIMALIANLLKNNKWVHLAVGIIGVAIFGVAVFKIATTNLEKVVLKVNIEYGLWLVFVGYLGIGVMALLEFLRLSKGTLPNR